MLNYFFNSIASTDAVTNGHVKYSPYNVVDKIEVVGKLNDLLARMSELETLFKYEYACIYNIREMIHDSDCSLTEDGMVFLNSIVQQLDDMTQ
ncbi:hypothetical protein [Microcystis phage Mel-JY01]